MKKKYCLRQRRTKLDDIEKIFKIIIVGDKTFYKVKTKYGRGFILKKYEDVKDSPAFLDYFKEKSKSLSKYNKLTAEIKQIDDEMVKLVQKKDVLLKKRKGLVR